MGTSDELSVTFDVLYSPREVLTSPQKDTNLDVGRSAQFKCDAESNPPAKFEWLQKLPEIGKERAQVYSRGFGNNLLLKNVSYEHEGKSYFCKIRYANFWVTELFYSKIATFEWPF